MVTVLIDYLVDLFRWLTVRPKHGVCPNCSPTGGLCDKHKKAFRSSNDIDKLLATLLMCKMIGYLRDGKPLFPNYVELRATELRLFKGNYYKVLSLYTVADLLYIIQVLNAMENRSSALTSLRNTIRNQVNSL